MQPARLFLLEFQAQNADVLTPLRAALTSAGHRVTPVMIDPDALDGSDASALRVLQQLRAEKTDASAVVVVFFAIIMALAALLLWTRQRVKMT